MSVQRAKNSFEHILGHIRMAHDVPDFSFDWCHRMCLLRYICIR